MSVAACFVCCTVSPGSVSALETICMPSGKSLAEQICRGLGGCLLPLMPEHVACISCQHTASHLDQLWTEAEMLQKTWTDKYMQALQQMESSTIMMLDSGQVVTATDSASYPESLLSGDPDDPGEISTKLRVENVHYTAEDSAYDAAQCSPSYVLMVNSGSTETKQPCDMAVSVERSQYSPNTVDQLRDQPSQSDEFITAASDPGPEFNSPVPEVSGQSSTSDTAEASAQEPAADALTAGRAARTGPKTCPHCGRTYRRWRDLDTHLSTHTGSLPHRCTECGRRFASRRRLTDHQRGHADGWSCPSCDKVFRHPSSLQHHRRQHERPAPASVCPVCSRTLSSAAQLRVHLRTHSDERPYQCASCPRAFRQASTLRAHARLHTGERPFQCDTCGKGFRARAAFMTHLQQHGAVAARFACDFCGKAFFYKSKMEQHRATHGGERAACCEQCGVTFSSVAALNRHQVAHSSKRPHVCSVCGRKFKEAGVLRKHQKQMHAANAAHECSVCGKRCAGPFKLSEHMRTHTGERPFACALCPKAFTQAVHLTMHQRTHQRAAETATTTVFDSG